MKRILFLICIVAFSWSCISQNTRIDSLENILKQAPNNTTKLATLLKIAEEAFYVDVKIYKITIDSLLYLAEKNHHQKYLALGFNGLARYYQQAGEHQASKKNYLKALWLYKNLKDPKSIGKVYGNIASLYMNLDKMDSVQFYTEKAIAINKKFDFFLNLFFNYYNLGVAESTQNNAKQAIEDILMALNYAEKAGNDRYIALSYSMIGILYLEQEMYQEAEKYLLRASKKLQELGDLWGLAHQYVNLGKLYNEWEQDYYKCIKLYKRALDNYNKVGDSINGMVALGNIGRNYISLNQLDSARTYISHTYLLAKKFQKQDELVRSLTNLGQIEFQEKNYLEANVKTQEALILAKKHKFRESYGEAILLLSKIHARKKNYKDAYKNLLLYHELADSIKSSENKKIIADITTKYQTEKKEKENLALKKQNAEKELAVQRATNLNLTYSILAGTAIVGLIGFFYYSKIRRRKLRDEHIISLARAKQKEHEKIGADLHSTKAKELEKIAGALEEKGEKDLAQRTRQIKENIRLLSHELFQIPFSQEEFDDQIINLLYEYNNESLEIQHDGIRNIKWKDVDDTIKRNLYLIISEAISNIRNHAKATQAMVKFKKRKKNIEITITDDGIGFTEDALKKGHGIGNMRMRAHEINGTIKFDRAKCQGSEVGIFIAL